MRASSTIGLSILAGGLAFVGSANAVDLIVNGSFEAEGRVSSGSILTGWTGFMGTYNHSGEAYYAGPAIPASENPGAVYSWQHRAVSGTDGAAGVAQVTQTVDLTAAVTAAEIDAGQGRYTFSAWLASYTDNPEQPYVTVQFFDVSTNALGSPIVFDRTSANFWVRNADPADLTPPSASNHMFSKYSRTGLIPQGGRLATVGIGRSPNAGLSGSPDTYVDLVALDVVSTVEPTPPTVDSTTPGQNAVGVRPDIVVGATLRDGTSAVNTNSIQFSFDGSLVSPSIQKTGAVTTIQYDPPGLLAPLSVHTAKVVFSDNHVPITTQTNQFSFTTAKYYNILLPSPIFLETFDSTAEESLPNGWTQISHSAVPDAVPNLADLNSFTYSKWTVVDSARFTNSFLSYNSHTPTDDYKRVLSFNQNNVVNGVVVEKLANGKIAFGDSGYRDGDAQVVYLFSKNFDLTGHQNVYLSFHSLWEQNQDSIAAVEYSIDGGTNWLPVVYMLDGPDVLRDGAGNIDPVATFGTVRIGGFQGQATYVDPNTSQTVGGNYGAFIGVDSNRWSTLAPYISARLDDDPVDSKRVEVYRLPAADNASKVQLRFAHAGTDSWYFGIDEVGLYSLSVVSPPFVNGPTPTNIVEAVGDGASFTVLAEGIGPFAYQWKHDGVTVAGQTNATLALTNLQLSSAGNYVAIVGYLGGSVTSAPASLAVFTPDPSRVLGEWDFNSFDTSATCGQDLGYFDNNVLMNTTFTTADFAGLQLMNGQDVNIMSFPGVLTPSMGGYKMYHGLSGTGGGTNVNQYTLIMDVLYPTAANAQRRSLLQTDTSNTTDGDFRIDESNGVGVSGNYHGNIQPNTWYRIALAVDLAGPGPHPIVAKFINGVKVGQHALGEGLDGRWSLSASPAAPYALLFADNDTEVQQGFVSSVQLRSGRLSDAAIEAMGGPASTKIPGAACARASGTNVVINWSGTVLESANEISGVWTPIPGAAKPYPVPKPLSGRKFYRSK